MVAPTVSPFRRYQEFIRPHDGYNNKSQAPDRQEQARQEPARQKPRVMELPSGRFLEVE